MRCPVCDQSVTPDDAGMVACACGYQGYAGYLQEYEYLTARLAWLKDRIDERGPAPDDWTAKEYRIWPAATSAPQQQPKRAGSTQVLLITLGAGLLILAALVFVAVAWTVMGPWGQIALLVVTTLVLAVTAIAVRRPAHRTAEALGVVSFALGLITSIAAGTLGVLPDSWNEQEHPYRFLVFAAAFGCGVGLGRRFGLRGWQWLGWFMVPAMVATALGLASPLMGNEQLAITVAALAYLLMGLSLVVLAGGIEMRVVGWVCLIIAVACTAVCLSFAPPVGAVLIIAVALLSLVILRDRLSHTWVDRVALPVFGFWLALVLLLPSATLTWVAGLVGAALLFVVARRSVGLAVISASTLWTTYLLGIEFADFDLLALIAGLALFAASLRKGAAPVAWLGAIALETALVLQIDDVPFIEAPTLVFAVLLLAAGMVAYRSGVHHSAVVLAPAVTVALVPTALLTWFDVWSQPALIRFGIVMVAGVVLLLIGVRRKMAGLVIPASIAVSIAATAQIFTTLDLLPRWLALAVAGVVLIAVGARIEWVRGKGRETEQWLQSLD